MADKPAFGVFPQMKPKRSQQDREAAKNVPVDLARGFVSGTLGMPGDIESLARLPYELITGKESPTILPTSGDIEKRLPFKSDTPVSRAATGLGQLGGGAYTGPLSGARAATAIPKAVVRAGKDFVQAAGQPVVNMVNPKGGLSLAKEAPQEKALLLAKQNAEKLGQSANPEVRMLQQGYEPDWYHGSTGDIIRFRSDLLGETTGAQSAKKGFFFARDPQNPPEAMLKKSNDPASIEMLKKLGIPEEEIAKLNTVSMKGHGAETASGYALIGGSREYKEAMRKASAAEKRGDWSEYEKQTQIAEDDAIRKSQYLQGLVAKYGDARDEMLDAIQKSIYNKKLPQEQAEVLDQKVKQLMPYGWYNSYSNPQLEGLKKEIVNLVGKNAAQTSLDKINKFQSVKNERALMERTEEGGNVMPVALRYKNPMVYDFEGKPYRDQSYSDLVDQAIAGGHDALILKNTYDPGSGPAKLVDVGVVFNADQVRSKFAAFDPLRKTTAIAASAGVAAPDLLAEERKAQGGEVTMDKGGAAFGVFPQMKGRRSKQDREAAKTFPIDVARGFVSGALGMPGDIESLVRMLPGLDEKTILPTSEDIEKRLPLRSDSPVSRAATGLGQIGGGFYTGPLSGARAVTAIPKAVGKAGRDFVMAAGQPAVNVVKPKGGNFLTDRLGGELSYLKSRGPSEADRAWFEQRALENPEEYRRGLEAIPKTEAINQWIDRNLTNYIKNQMATPEDPVRLMLDKRTGEIEAKFAKDMERANKLAERAAAETDPRMKVNLTRNAEQAKMAAEMERDLSMSHILPQQESILENARFNEYHAKVNRAVEGFPEEGMAKSPAGKAWEDITDSDIGMTVNRAGDAQSAAEKVQKAKEASGALEDKVDEIDRIFEQRLRRIGELTEEQISALMRQSPKKKLEVIRDPDLTDSFRSLVDDLQGKNSDYKINDLNISRDYPWVAKLDPETRLYEFYGSESLGFDHIIDVLKQDVAAGRITPDQLNRMSVDQAVRRAAEYDKELAEKMNSARAAAREGLPVYKEYPEGYRWVELNKPGSFASESEAMGHSVRGYEPPKGHPDWMEGSGNEGSEYYGHGGWEGIKSGKAKVYSLVDPKGNPHVTVEAAPAQQGWQVHWRGDDEVIDQTRTYRTEREAQDAAREWQRQTGDEAYAKEYTDPNAPFRITQIKGKQNTRPNEKYDQYTQDFVKSGNWSDVRDLGNTGLIRIDPESDLAKGLAARGSPVPSYASQNEITDLLKQAEVGSYSNPSRRETFINPDHPDWADDGMKRGGRVSISDNADSQMMDVLDKKMAGGGLLKGLKTAAKAAKAEPSLPLNLPRAAAKTKEEIRPVAQRMAQQMTGEFVRPDPKKSINPAGKSGVQFEMEKGLTHDIRPTEGRTLLPQEVADIEKQQGLLKIGVSGDTSIADKTLYRAGPYELDLASPQHGGPLFALGGEGAWASNNPVAATFQKRVQELSQAHGDAPVLGQFLAMGPQGSNFALHFADANLRAIDPSKMTKGQVEQFNKLIREGSEKSGPRPSFPGIEDKESAYLHFAFDPELRKHFNALMQLPKYTDSLGLPDGRVILHAITEPELRNTEVLTSGLSQMRLDPSVNPSDLKLSAHPTYSHVIPRVPESPISRTKYPVPAELEFPDVAEFIKHNYRPRDATRVYQTATPRQMVDPQHIDEMKMYEELMKEYTGKKEGGEVEMQAGGLAKLAKSLKAVPKKIEAPTVVIPGDISRVQQAVRESKGDYGAKRVQRAADEIKNLEKMYQEEGLRFAFTGDNAQALMTMNPADFEKYANPLMGRTKADIGPKMAELAKQGEIDKYTLPTDEYIQHLMGLRGGFEEPAFLSINKQEQGLPLVPFISGHEGRHRSRALAASGEPTSLVRLIPRAELREPFPRRSQEEYIEALRRELEMTNQMIVPEGNRPAIRLPDIYAKGGEVHMAGGGILSKMAKALKGTQEVLPAAEREANLQRMLAESKAPMRLYHGTQKDIRKFKAPVFLSPDPAFANKFAMDDMLSSAYDTPTSAPSGANVMPVHASVERPFDYENPSHISKVAKSLDPKDRKQFKSTASSGSWKDIENFLDSIEESGFDAAHILEQGRKNIVVFDPDRVKSAIGNRGTYDTSKPDLNEAIGGLIKVKNKRKARG